MRLFLLAFLALTPAWACSCLNTATPCSVLGGSSVVFVAEVSVDSGEGWGKGPAKVVIVEPLQNVPEGLKEATIETGAGSSCYYRLRAGERYVIITDGSHFSVSGCNPSFRVHGNEHILDAMRSRVRGGAPRLMGSVLKTTGPYSKEGGISNVTVELKRGESRLTAHTDGEGRYVLVGLDPGRYQIQVYKDGYVPDEQYNRRWSGRLVIKAETNTLEPLKEVPGEIEILANSCAIRDLSMWPAGSIRGTVRGLDGTAVRGLPVQVFALDRRGERESSPLQTAVTDSDGKYNVQPLPSGQYVIGVNARLSEDDNAYPPTLYNDGRSVYLGEVGSMVGIDLVVPAPRTPAQLRIKVLTAAGKPHKGATVRLDTPAGVQRWFSREHTNDNGELMAPVFVGQRYNVKAFHYSSANGRSRHWEGIAPVDVTGREAAVTVVLQVEQ